MVLMVLFLLVPQASRQLYLIQNMKKLLNYVLKNQKERYPLLLEQVQIPQMRRYLLQNMLKRLELTVH